MANAPGGNRRSRNGDSPNWYVGSLTDNFSARHPDVVMEIPKDKVGLIIGRKGRRLKEIKELSGAHVDVKDDKVHLRGTPEQCEKAKKYIEEILNPVSIGGFSFRKVGDALSQRKNKRFGPFEPNLDLKKRGKTPSRRYTIAGQRKQTNQSNLHMAWS